MSHRNEQEEILVATAPWMLATLLLLLGGSFVWSHFHPRAEVVNVQSR